MRISSYNIIEKFNRYTKMVPDFVFSLSTNQWYSAYIYLEFTAIEFPVRNHLHPLNGDTEQPLNLPLCVTTHEVCGRSRVIWSSLNMSSAIFLVC